MAKRGRSAALISLDGLPNIRLETTILVVGRSSECDVVVDSKKVSRKHCAMALVGEALVVKDLGSTNGCKVNGQRHEECRVNAGDELTIADLHYRFQWDHPAGDTMLPPSQLRPSDSMIERCDHPVLLPDDDIPLAQQPKAARPRSNDLGDSSAMQGLA